MSSYVAQLIAIIQAGVTGPAPADISPPPVPANATFTYVTVSQLPSSEVESMDGQSGLCRSLMQISCWDKDYEAAWAMRKAIQTLLLQYVVTPSTAIKGVNNQHATEIYDGNRSLHHVILRLWVWWEH